MVVESLRLALREPFDRQTAASSLAQLAAPRPRALRWAMARIQSGPGGGAGWISERALGALRLAERDLSPGSDKSSNDTASSIGAQVLY